MSATVDDGGTTSTTRIVAASMLLTMESPGTPPRAYRIITSLLGLVVRIFFREVEISGLGHVPERGGGVIVSWHPNGLIDPILILTPFPRQVVFGARHGLFKFPLLGFLFRRIGTVPIYRAQDAKNSSEDARRAANKKSVDVLAGEVARGSFSALFPEGVSHDEPGLVELKSGVAHLYYRARELQDDDAPPPVILPVGVHYDDKTMFRSRAHVCFHPPIELSAELDVAPPPDEDTETARDRTRSLMSEIEHVLKDIVHATEDWDVHISLHRARKILRAERAKRAGADPGMSGIGERSVAFARVRRGYYDLIETCPEVVLSLRRRIERYDQDLRAVRLTDHELDRYPSLFSPTAAALLFLQVMFVFLLLPPVLLVGLVVNVPTGLFLAFLTRAVSRMRKDEATVKMLVGAIVFPLTWIGAGIAAAVAYAPLHEAFPAVPDQPVLAGIVFALLSAVGGVVALRYRRLARDTLRAVRVRFTRLTRRRSIEGLLAERAALHDALVSLAEGLDLPGEVMADGKIRSSS